MKQDIIVSMDEKHILKLIEYARQGNTVRLLGVGNSMRPFLMGGRDYIDLIAVNNELPLNKYDVVFYQYAEDKYVLHRIYSISKEGYHLNGDGNLMIEPPIDRSNIYLKAIGFVRKGKYISTKSISYQCYVRLWTCLRPFRLYLLKLHRMYCKAMRILKRRKE